MHTGKGWESEHVGPPSTTHRWTGRGVVTGGPHCVRRVPARYSRHVSSRHATAPRIRRVGIYGRCVSDSSILLTRLSAREPDAGRWTLPGGGMDFGETPHETLTREFHEETGLVPRIGGLVAVHSYVSPATPRRGPLHVLQFVYDVAASGSPTVVEVDGSTAEAAWVRIGDATELPLVELAAWAVAG